MSRSQLITVAVVLAILIGSASRAAALTFRDPRLEAAVSSTAGKPAAEFTQVDVQALVELDASGRDISDLGGLEALVNLTRLNLRLNQIDEVSALAELTSLRSLDLYGNRIADVSPLANLTGLTHLDLGENPVTDFSPLARLTNLAWLEGGAAAPALEGTVRLRVLVDAAGKPDFEVITSSGRAAVDRVCVETLAAEWYFAPLGAPYEVILRVQYMPGEPLIPEVESSGPVE